MADAPWLDALKAGDTVVQQSGYGYKALRLLTVERVTPKQVIVCDPRTGSVLGRYWRDSGMAVGGPWSDVLLEATPNRLARIREQETIERLTRIAWDAVAPDVREQVLVLLERSR